MIERSDTELTDEEALLGCILADTAFGRQDAIEACRTRGLDWESFADADCGRVYREMCEQSGGFDATTLSNALKEKSVVLRGDTANFIHWLDEMKANSANCAFHLNRVLAGSRRRRALDMLGDFAGRIKSAAVVGDVEFLVGKLSGMLLDLVPDELESGSFAASLAREKSRLADLVKNGQGAMEGLSTGYGHLDEKLFGLKKGELIVVAARPSIGKTTLGMNIALNVARKGCPVLVFSVEMDRDSLARRMLAGEAKVDQWRAVRAQLAPEEKSAALARLEKAGGELSPLPIYVEDRGVGDILQVRTHARRMCRKAGIGLVVVDYLQLLNNRETVRLGRQYETASISRELKTMARELKVPVIAISQLNRGVEQRGGSEEKPKLSDLRDSGAIEQDADVVMLLRRPAVMKGAACPENEKDLVWVDVAKHRNGEIGELPMRFDGAYNRFEELPEKRFLEVVSGNSAASAAAMYTAADFED